jgi:hypothetical protein
VPNLHHEDPEWAAKADRIINNLAAERGVAAPLAAQVAAAKQTLPVMAPSGTLHQIPRERWLAAVGKALAGLEDVVAMKLWSEAMTDPLAHAREVDDALAHQAEQLIAGRMLQLAGPPEPEPEPGATEPEDAALV